MLYERICEKENLEEAWKRVRANRPRPGVDRVGWQSFEKSLSYNLAILQRQLQDESYRPLPVMVYKDEQAGRKPRTIGLSTVRDKIVQQAVLRVLGPVFEPHFLPCCYAYRPRKSALAAVNVASRSIRDGSLWMLKTDVASFFDTMDHGILLELLRRKVDEKPLIKLLSRLLKAKIFKEMGLFDNLVGTQQGSGLSPLLSNIYLHPLDTLLWGKYHERYVRYSDDISILAWEKETLEEALLLIEQGLTELKLAASKEKTTITHVAGGVVLLGFYLDVKGKGPSEKAIGQLQESLARYDKVRKTDDIEARLAEVRIQVRGWYNYYQTLRPVKPGNILSLIALAEQAREVSEPQHARELLKEFAGFSHNHPRLACRLGDLFCALGMHNQGTREYARALELDPETAEAREKIRGLQENDPDIHQAIDKIQLVLHHNPHFREGYQGLAELYGRLGLYGFAEKALSKALELDDEPLAEQPAPESPGGDNEDQALADFPYRALDLEGFLAIFSGRENVHAKQWVDERGRWGFLRVERPLGKKDVYKHLKGEVTLGVYPVTAADEVGFIVFDVDTARRAILEAGDEALEDFRARTHQDILRLKAECDRLGLHLYIEDSGYKGRHGWLFFAEKIHAPVAIRLGRRIMDKAGGPGPDMVWELFPMGKSDRDKSIIKLPLGINQKSKRRCLFLGDDGRPLPAQDQVLKSIRKNPIEAFRDEAETAPEAAGPDAAGIAVPEALAGLVNGCKVVGHLVTKARETNYLNHYERICLLYTLTFAGQEGSDFLHTVISHCINYDRQFTQAQIERRKDRPISCAKIMENFPELAETLPCDCRFDLPPRSYPSPVLHLLKAELAESRLAVQLPQVSEESGRAEAIEEKKEPAIEKPAAPAVLDFEALFRSEEQGVGTEGECPTAPASAAPAEVPAPPKLASPAAGLPAETEPPGEEMPMPAGQAIPAISAAPALPAGEDELGELVIRYLSLKHGQAKMRAEMQRVASRLEEVFSDKGEEVLSSPMGRIRRIRDPGGRIGWVIET